MRTQIYCARCGENLDESYNIKPHKKCPNCGSVDQNLFLTEDDSIKIHNGVEGKIKNSNYSSKKNPRVAFFQGDDQRKSDGKWMEKEKLLDKDNDEYKEIVIDPETGDVIHHCEQPLSDHQGHGSAKKRKV